MDQEDVLRNAKEYVRKELGSDSSGHDWWHANRVSQMAVKIAEKEGGDGFICELAAWLHDTADEKLIGDEEAGLASVRKWLERNNINPATTSHVVEIIATMSFKGGNRPAMRTLEGKIVQDADRLDAIGAIGIARVFAYSGAKGQPIHDPDLLPRESMTLAEYRGGKSTAINHFYEKLLHLKDTMNTAYAMEMAEARHQRLLDYLNQFLLEWNGMA